MPSYKYIHKVLINLSIAIFLTNYLDQSVWDDFTHFSLEALHGFFLQNY